MSIDMILGMAESQTQGIKNLVTKQNEAYTELQKSLAEFILQTDKLKGVTYDSAKKYCAVVIEPLVRGCILLNEEISRANENYINTYKSEVDTVSLKQQELERLIREAESQIRRVEHLLNLLYQEDPISYSQISMAEENKETYRKLKNELEEKLRKLLAFNAKSPSIFSEVEVLKSSVDQGLAQAEKSWSPTSKTFNLPSRSDMGWASVIESIDAKYTAEKERLKSENNNKLTDQEYDRVISQITGINGKPLFGASVIKNASPEEKKDLLLATLPWIMPGGTLRLTMLSGGALGLIDGLVSKDKPSDVIKKMAFGSSFALFSHLSFNLLGKGAKVKNFFKPGKNAEDKLLKNVKNESLKSRNNLSQRGSINQVKIAESGTDGKLKPTILYNAKEFPRELKKYPRDMILNNTNNKIITVPRNEKIGNNLVQKTTNEQSRLLNQIEKEKVNSHIVYGKKEFLEEMAKLPRVDLSKKVEDGLVSIKKGEKPKPEFYLSNKEIETHLKLFKDGVVKIVSEDSFDKTLREYGGFIGPVEGQFAMPKFVYNKAVKASNGNPRVLEELLGLEKGFLGENPVVIEPKELKFLKFPSGNEPGAYVGLWQPPGFTKGGIPEAVINQLAPDEYINKKVYEGVLNK